MIDDEKKRISLLRHKGDLKQHHSIMMDKMKKDEKIKVDDVGDEIYIQCAELCGFNIFRLTPDKSKFVPHNPIVKAVLKGGKLEVPKRKSQT